MGHICSWVFLESVMMGRGRGDCDWLNSIRTWPWNVVYLNRMVSEEGREEWFTTVVWGHWPGTCDRLSLAIFLSLSGEGSKRLHIVPQSVLFLCYKPQALGFPLSHNWCLLVGHLGVYFVLSRGLLLLIGIKVPLIQRSLATKLNSLCFTSKCALSAFILEYSNKKCTCLQAAELLWLHHDHHFHCWQWTRHTAYSTLLQSWKTLLFNHIHISRPSFRSFSSRKLSIITLTLRNIFIG